ncbi:copper amine oxidase N-terminal domain-containing protein [Paenibacillus hamazuiensis]|uniref:copper amine oxidase N-terminal domain-containing protein n=1 Tax=Paenibacillus hamazuiensis TaxID=2936508 RepID=UPI00200C836C|nr:copper amine oxidase N-terminal domain-containing protein [Paenibacillus hamazuiensis]
MKKWIASIAGFMAIALTGCQASEGVDLNKVMKNTYSVTSSEASQTLTVRLTADNNSALTGNTKQFMDLFGNASLNLKEIKMQDRLHVSVKGDFVYSKGTIPFQMNSEGQDLIIQVEGAKKPIVLHRTAVPAGEASELISEQLKKQLEELTQKSADLAPAIGSFLAGTLPNPARMYKKTETSQVHGETLTLNKFHADVNGTELLGLVKSFLTNVAADEKGLKDLIGQLYDVFVPVIKEAMKSQEQGADGNAQLGMYMQYLDNKTLAVEFAATSVKGLIQNALNDFDASAEKLSASENGKAAQLLLSDKMTFATDVYIDSDNQIRKSYTEFKLALPAEESGGLKEIQVTSASENWNINKPVSIAPIDRSSAVEFDGTSSTSPSKLLAALDSKSQIYKFLKDDLRITKKDLHLVVDSSGSGDAASPYNKDGNVMVPARYVVESLDANVDWDGSTKQVIVTDELRGVKVVLTIGSPMAAVNGVIKPLEAAPEIMNGSTFVPIRVIAEALGARVSWDGDANAVVIQRD